MAMTSNGDDRREVSTPDAGGELFARHAVNDYNDNERRFSGFIQLKLEKLLRGELNALPILRRYHQDAGRLGTLDPPWGLEPGSMRLSVVEKMLTRALVFLQTGLPGGPITQDASEGYLLERQLFGTRFPHIVIERIDSYEAASGTAVATEWIIKRFQNQHAENRMLRALDLTNIGLELLRVFR
jgi:hypothetical protein